MSKLTNQTIDSQYSMPIVAIKDPVFAFFQQLRIRKQTLSSFFLCTWRTLFTLSFQHNGIGDMTQRASIPSPIPNGINTNDLLQYEGELSYEEGADDIQNYNNNNNNNNGNVSKGKRRRNAIRRGAKSCLRLPFVILRRLWSISGILLVLLALSISLTGISIWLLNFLLSKHATNTMATQNRNELLARISGQLDDYFSNGPRIAQTIRQEFFFGDSNGFNSSNSHLMNSRDRMISTFAVLMRYSILDGVWYGTEDNYLTGLLVNVYNQSLVDLTLTNNDGAQTLSNIDLDTLERGPVYQTFKPYDLRTRPWYTTAKEARHMRWSGVHSAAFFPTMRFTFGVPYFYPSTNQFQGVIVASFDLISISNFLVSLEVEKDAITLVLDRNLDIIGSSTGKYFQVLPNNTAQQLNALDDAHVVIRDTARRIKEIYGRPVVINGTNITEFVFKDSIGQKRSVGLKPYQDPFGIDWIIVSVLSESVTLASVNTATRVSLVISACCLIGAVFIAIILGCIITRPLSSITKEINQIAHMNFRDKKIRHMGLYEMQEMAVSLHSMRSGLCNFELFVPSDVVRALVLQKQTAKLGVSLKSVTIMFAVIRARDQFFENIAPEMLVEVLQLFFTCFSDIISQQSGVIDKYMGECVMALFNAPTTVAHHARKGVAAAMLMHQKMIELNQTWLSRGFPELYATVGLNTANCLVGNIGTADRVSYTALGDGVNVASRLEALNKRYKTQTLIGPCTFAAVRNRFLCRWIGRVCVKGKTQPLDIFEVLCGTENPPSHLIQLSHMHCQLQDAIDSGNLNQAKIIVASILQSTPDDPAILEMSLRLNQPNFSPVLSLATK